MSWTLVQNRTRFRAVYDLLASRSSAANANVSYHLPPLRTKKSRKTSDEWKIAHKVGCYRMTRLDCPSYKISQVALLQSL